MKSVPHTSRPKILITMEGVLGGTLRHLDYLLRIANPAEWDIHLGVSAIRAPHVDEDFQRWETLGWSVHRIPMQRDVHPGTDMPAFRAIDNLCRKHHFDLIHTHCAKAGFLGRFVAHLTNTPAIHTPHVFPFTHVGGDVARFIYRELERMASTWTQRFVMLSNFQKNVAIDAGLAKPARCEIIPNGIIPSDFSGPSRAEARRTLGLPSDGPIALFVGRFRPQKGLDMLLDAATELRRRSNQPQIVIVGEGPLKPWLDAEISRRRLDHFVSNHGFTRQIELYYAACDLVVMPSRAEGMPYVVLESQAAGRPVAATLVSGMEEFIRHGSNGYLIPSENPDALAGLLHEKLQKRRHLANMGLQAARNFPDRWHAEQMVRHTCNLWGQVI
jgi:glycosyltransferase involved in cell wall biosynthesis